jgi:hypothetical protein
MYTAEQALGILWSHHHHKETPLNLKESDVDTLVQLVVQGYEELSKELKGKLVPQNLSHLLDFFLSNRGSSPFKDTLSY